MKTQIQKQENVSHTIQAKTKAANQASMEQVLQKYRDKTIQREAAPNNTGLPDNLKSGIENLSGYSMDDVRVHYNSPKIVQRYTVPADLINTITDIGGIIADISATNHTIPTTPPGGDIWAAETRNATLRKLSEWGAFKLTASSYSDTSFGTDVVTQPDVFTPSLFFPGNMTNVVENKYVSGGRARITENVKDALGQLLVSNRSPYYVGKLSARVVLSDDTRRDLKDNTNGSGFSRMIHTWQAHATVLKRISKVLSPYNLWLIVENLPPEFQVLGKFEEQL